MFEELIAQRVLDVARHADDQHPHEEPEDALQQRESDDEAGIVGEFFAGNLFLKTIHRILPGHPRRCQKEDIGADNADKAENDPQSVLLEMVLQAAENAPLLRVNSRHRFVILLY